MRIGDLKYIGMTGYSVAVPHMGLFYVALHLLRVLNGVAPKNSPFTIYHIQSGPVCDIPHMEWPRMRHTTYGVPDAKSAICDVPYMADHPYGTYCPFSEFWRITLKIRIWRVTVCKRLGGQHLETNRYILCIYLLGAHATTTFAVSPTRNSKVIET